MTTSDHPVGIDFGGTGIKAAPVDIEAGDFAAQRERIPTPRPSRPDAVAAVFVDLLAKFPDCHGPVGVTVPGVVHHGVVHTAANIHHSWVGTDADALFTEATGRDVHVVNDADAAGLAEVRYGAAKGQTAWSSSPRSAPASARRSCTTACWCRTPSSATLRSTATTPSHRPRTAPAPARSCRGRRGRSG